jgi:hypothetical protein
MRRTRAVPLLAIIKMITAVKPPAPPFVARGRAHAAGQAIRSSDGTAPSASPAGLPGPLIVERTPGTCQVSALRRPGRISRDGVVRELYP